jgi:hypothetical protein
MAALESIMKDKKKHKQSCKPMDPIAMIRSVFFGHKRIDEPEIRERYYYNAASKTCIAYKDTGCGKNVTDFSSRQGCEAVCKSK